MTRRHYYIPIWFSIIMSVLAIIGWTLHWHLTINNTRVIQNAPISSQDGHVSVAQCSAMKAGTSENEIVSEYGLPKGDLDDNGTTDMLLAYPLAEDNSKNCTISFHLDSHKVSEVQLDLIGYTAGS